MPDKPYCFAERIKLGSDLGAKYAIVPGDPGRVAKIAAYLDDPQPLAVNREYTSYAGYVDGAKIVVISTGMGGPSTAIAVEELYQIGVRTFIRLGTCGGMQLPLLGGDLVIPTGAIRQEGTTREYIHIEFPAVANFAVVSALQAAAQASGARYHLGIVQSKDSFYGQMDPLRMPIGTELKAKYDSWIKAGTLASEMECSTLFTVAQILGARAGAVLHCIWNKEREVAGLPIEVNRDLTRAIQTAVGALRELIRAERAQAETNG